MPGESLGPEAVDVDAGFGDPLVNPVGDGLADLLPPLFGCIDGPGEGAE